MFKELLRTYVNYPVRPWDSELEKLRKNLLMALYPFVLFANAILIFAVLTRMGQVNAFCMVTVSTIGWSHLLVMKRATPFAIKLYIFVCTLSTIGYDLMTASENSSRAWPLQVILIDVLLVTRIDLSYSMGLVVFMFFYLVLISAEDAFRFGLYDLPFLATQKQRRENYTCDNLPCADVGLSLQSFLACSGTFLLDFYFTRGFASSLVEEKAKVEASVETAEKIARSLANFDLDSAEDDLTDNHGLPPKLHAAFDNILQNLKLYRPFLPNALFEDSREGFANNPLVRKMAPPGTVGDSRVAVVFTDIQGSTAIWEACPEGMRRALKLHNKTIRKVIDTCQGYEVKTIGDAFMVAFTSPTDAVDFGLAVQKALVACTWPLDLMELPLCERDSEGLWGGLRVRVGVHYGEAEVELNSVTGRYDYFGNTVNVASRVEAASVGGGVAITPEVLAAVTDRSSFIEIPIGLVPLRGVAECKKLSILLPVELRGRKQHTSRQLRLRRSDISDDGVSSTQIATSSRLSVIELTPITRLEHIVNATVGCVEARIAGGTGEGPTGYSFVNESVCWALNSLDRCGGTVVAVVGSSITVGWNTAKKTSTHFESSLMFASHVMSKSYEDGEVRVGLSSGPVLSATLGTHGQRFVTVMGDCVKLSCAMAAAAAEFRTSALFCCTRMRSDLKNILRPLTTWEVHSSNHKPKPLVVYEISIPRLYDTDLRSMMEGFTNAVPETWCWSDAYWDAFKAKKADLLMKKADGDAAVIGAAGMMKQKARALHL